MIELRAAQLPNLITVVRILLVVPTGWLLLEARYVEALVLMAIAGLSDALDGWLARSFDWTSRLGAIMDPIADKLLVAAMFVIFTVQGHIPLWVTSIVLGRDAVIMTGAGVYRLLYKNMEFVPTFVSKANTAMQIVMLLGLLLALCEFPVVSGIAGRLMDPWCFYILAVLGISSGVDYVITWGSRTWRNARRS